MESIPVGDMLGGEGCVLTLRNSRRGCEGNNYKTETIRGGSPTIMLASLVQDKQRKTTKFQPRYSKEKALCSRFRKSFPMDRQCRRLVDLPSRQMSALHLLPMEGRKVVVMSSYFR